MTPPRRPAVTPTRSPSASPPRCTSARTPSLGAHARAVPLVRRHGRQPRRRHRRQVRCGAGDADIPQALTDYIKGREGYDYNEHGRAGNTHAEFVPDDIVDRFCVLGTPEDHIAKLEALKEHRRPPVRGLPPARQQGGDPAGLRRDDHAGAARPRGRKGVTRMRRSLRAVLLGALGVVLVAALWDLYKALRPGGGRLRRRAHPRSCRARPTSRCRTPGRWCSGSSSRPPACGVRRPRSRRCSRRAASPSGSRRVGLAGRRHGRAAARRC